MFKRKDNKVEQLTHQLDRRRAKGVGRRRAIEVLGVAMFGLLVWRTVTMEFPTEYSTAEKTKVQKTDSKSSGAIDKSRWPITDEWLCQCVKQIEGNPKIVKPFCEGTADQLGYRLGDCIKACRACDPKKFVGSMAADYYDRGCPEESPNFVKWGNLSIVNEIFKLRHDNKKRFQSPDPDTLVIHLRLGDIVDKTSIKVEKMLTEGGNPKHHKTNKDSIKSVYELLSNVEESGLSKVSIVGGSHHPEFYKKSRVYAGCIERAFKKVGLQVTMELDSCDPDHDFFYISHARKLIVSGGAFSRLMGMIVEHRGGKVIGRQFIPENFNETGRLLLDPAKIQY